MTATNNLRLASRLAILVVVFAAAHGAAQPAASSGETAEQDDGFVTLLGDDAVTLWVAYQGKSWPKGWKLENGVLHRAASADDLMTKRSYRDFELRFDWKVTPGANSGVIYRSDPGGEHSYHTGPEYQVLDDARHRDGKSPLTSAGAIYALYPAAPGLAKPAGQWNAGAIRIENGRLQHFLNGKLSAEAEIGSDDWNAHVAKSKFSSWPGFGKAREGRIVIQDHGNEVWFRNMRIKELPAAAGN